MPGVRCLSAKAVGEEAATKSDLRVLRTDIIGAVALLILAHLGAVYAMLP